MSPNICLVPNMSAAAKLRLDKILSFFAGLCVMGLALLSSQAHAQAAPSAYTTSYRYDLAGRVLGTILPDPDGSGPLSYRATRNTIDARGLVTRTQNGKLASWQADTIAPANWTGYTVAQQVDYFYDPMGRKVQETTSSGGTILTLTQFSYDSVGRLQCTALRMNSAVFPSSVTTAFPTAACDLGATGSQGPDRITYQTYDQYHRVLQVVQGYGTPAQRNYVTYTRTAWGAPQTSTDANGNTTTLAYDQFGRLSSMYFPSPASPGTSNSADYEAYGYDSNGNRTYWRRRDGQIINDCYDALNRTSIHYVHADASNCTATGGEKDVYTRYDNMGNVISKRFASFSGTGVGYTYDGLGRLSSATDMQGRTVGYAYNAASARVSLIHPDLNAVGYGLDTANRLITLGWNATSGLLTQGYDDLGRLSGLGKGGGSTSYSYDGVGRLSSMTNDLAGTTYDVTWTFGYNPASQIQSSSATSTIYDYKERTTATVNKTHDGLNRDTGIVSVGGYDARGNLTYEGSGGRTMSYDIENRLLTVNSSTANMKLEYDPEGRLYRYSTDGGQHGRPSSTMAST
jgi:YD repeat-containing protein